MKKLLVLLALLSALLLTSQAQAATGCPVITKPAGSLGSGAFITTRYCTSNHLPATWTAGNIPVRRPIGALLRVLPGHYVVKFFVPAGHRPPPSVPVTAVAGKVVVVFAKFQ